MEKGKKMKRIVIILAAALILGAGALVACLLATQDLQFCCNPLYLTSISCSSSSSTQKLLVITLD